VSEPELVRCGWCPVIMIHDMTAGDRGVASGSYPLRHGIRGPDWDIAELDGGLPG
jgi:hypothetical protein